VKLDLSKFKASAKKSEWNYSLAKMMSCRFVDVIGYVTDMDGTPGFQMTKLILEDGTEIACEGEHDQPYLAYNKKLNNLCEKIWQQENPEESEGTDD
jgi:hypothetical protein